MVKNITNMFKKDYEVKWIVESKESFQQIKESLGESLVLIISNYDKDFLIFSFSSTHNIDVVFLHKIEKYQEHPIAFLARS
jgi:hypothetical protein